MARKTLVCTLIVAVFAAALLGAQADTQNGMLESIEELMKNMMQRLQDAVQQAQKFIEGVKQRIRQEEDKLLSQIPDPLGQLMKGILDRIHKAEDQKFDLAANMTECVTSEAKPAFGIIRDTMEAVRSCVDEKTSDIKSTITDFEGLIRQAMQLLNSAPREVISCIKFPLNGDTWPCVTKTLQDASSKALMLASSLIGDMRTIGGDIPQIIRSVVNCGVEQRLEAEKKLGQIIEKIGACEKDTINKSS